MDVVATAATTEASEGREVDVVEGGSAEAKAVAVMDTETAAVEGWEEVVRAAVVKVVAKAEAVRVEVKAAGEEAAASKGVAGKEEETAVLVVELAVEKEEAAKGMAAMVWEGMAAGTVPAKVVGMVQEEAMVEVVTAASEAEAVETVAVGMVEAMEVVPVEEMVAAGMEVGMVVGKVVVVKPGLR